MKLALSMLVLMAGINVWAQQAADQTQSSTVNNKDVKPAAAAAKTGDIDDEITNARLRAVTGAKSDFSFWSSFSYAGSSLLNPTSSQRPQLNAQNAADPTNLSGQVSGKYRLTEHDSLIAGVGVQYTPSFTDNSGTNQPTSTTVQSPYVDYNRAFRVGAYQNVIDVNISKYTLGTDVSQNLNWAWSLSHTVMREVGESKRLSLGLSSALAEDVYTAAGQAGGYTLQAAVEPVLEYAITDKASFRTVYRMVMLNEVFGTNSNWSQATQTESAGIGYAITRDIYVYPNMQWLWNRIAADVTTVGFGANINL